jgi:hypothetical membrane protein
MNGKKAKIKSFWISFFYVGIGTISLLGLYPDDFFYWEFSLVGVFLTLPISFISFGILYSESVGHELILIIQLVMFLLFWFFTYKIFR